MQRLVHVTTRCYELATTTRPYQRNIKTGTSIYQRPTSAFRNDSPDLSCPRRLSNCIQRLDRSQLTSIKHLAVSTTRPTPATLVERPAANIYNATIPANDVTHPNWRLHTTATDIYIHICNSGNKIVTFVLSIISPFCLPSLSLAMHTRRHINLNSFAESTHLSAPQQSFKFRLFFWVSYSYSISRSYLPRQLENSRVSQTRHWNALVVFSGWYCEVWGWRSRAKGKAVLPLEYLTPYFGYFILPPHWLVSVTPNPRKSLKNYTKEKTATDKGRRRFFYTFLYLLGSTTIPWMREFFLNTLKWLNPPVKVSKIRLSFHVCVCPHLVFRASIRVSFLWEVC